MEKIPDKQDEVMEGLGRQERPITIMIPVSKIWNWWKKRRKRDEKKNSDFSIDT